MAGSGGTLGVMTTLTLKVLPKAEKTRSVLVFGLDMAAAGKAMTEALRSPYEVSAAAFLPAGLAARSAVSYVAEAQTSVTAIRVEGPGPSVERSEEHTSELQSLMRISYAVFCLKKKKSPT